MRAAAVKLNDSVFLITGGSRGLAQREFVTNSTLFLWVNQEHTNISFTKGHNMQATMYEHCMVKASNTTVFMTGAIFNEVS